MEMVLDEVLVKTNVEIAKEEAVAYIERARNKYKGEFLKSININIDGEDVDLKYEFAPHQFDRTRRITGYLVGTMDRWNNAKRSEEKDRIKHML